MFSAKKLVDDLHPYERSHLINYLTRPYLVRIATELGIDAKVAIASGWNVADFTNLMVKSVRLLQVKIKEQEKQIKNQKKEIVRCAQVAFSFMEDYVQKTNTA